MKNRFLLKTVSAAAVMALLAPALIGTNTVITALADTSEPDLMIWADRPATVPASLTDTSTWSSEATPIGNGHMGAMIYGGVGDESLLINENTIWSGGPGGYTGYNGGNLNQPATNKTQLNLMRQKLQDAADQGTDVSWDTQSAFKNYLIGNTASFGSYQELGLLRLGDNPLQDLESAMKNLQSNAAGSGAESIDKAFDGNLNTKWCYGQVPTTADPIWITWEYGGAVTADSYQITTGNDMPARDPADWALMGSNTAGGPYTAVDTQTGYQLTDNRKATVTFDIASPAAYRYYRLELYAIKGSDSMCQMSEFKLLGDFNKGAPPPDTAYTNYKRSLDLKTGVVTVTYQSGGVNYQKDYFMSYPDNILAIRITADKPGSVTKYVGTDIRRQNEQVTVDGDTITAAGQPDDQSADGLHFYQQIRVIPEGGTLTHDDVSVQVKNANAVTVLMTAGTNYQPCADGTYQYFSDSAAARQKVADCMNAAVHKGYAALLADDQADYTALFDRVSISLDGAVMPDMTTAALVDGYNNANTAAEDRYLELLYYQFGRYLMIASSRDGLPVTAQGIWSWGMAQPNQGVNPTSALLDYRLADTGSLPECGEAMTNFTLNLAADGKNTAEAYNAKPDGSDVRGWNVYGSTNLWGYTAPGNYPAGYSPTAAAKLVQTLWDRYYYSGDTAFLAANYRTMLDAALFWVDNLWPDAGNGKLTASPSSAYTFNSYADQTAILQLFMTVYAAAHDLGKTDDPAVSEIKAAGDNLEANTIDLNGGIGQLYDLYPGTVPGAATDAAALLDANGTGGTGAEQGWKLGLWAKLGDGGAAYAQLQSLMAGLSPNLMYNNSIDGNLAGAAGIDEMLIQNNYINSDTVDLLPALPSAWKSGSISGVTGENGKKVSVTWQNGVITSVTVAAGTDGDCVLDGPGLRNLNVTDQIGNAVTASKNGDRIAFQAKKGAVYIVSNSSFRLGDVNADGSINTVDARLVLQSIVGKVNLDTLNGTARAAADVNMDGKIDTVDARMILQYIVNKIDHFG